MQFSIDTILMTLLVGAITCLSIMSLLFLTLDSQVKIRWIGRVFRFILFERQPYLAAAVERQEDESTSQSVFIGLLLIACMFGLGVATEIASDSLSRKGTFSNSIREKFHINSDSDIRVASFLRVGGSEVQNGRPNDKLRRLYTDYVACQNIEKPEKGGPCDIVAFRVTSAYYYAKNSVFSKQNYFNELKDMQARIDFTRAMSYSFGLLGIMLFLGFVLALLAEGIDLLARTLSSDSIYKKWWRGKLRGGDGFVSHVKNLSETRLLILTILSLGASWSALNAWAGLEEGYDNRVFGYFLCEKCMGSETPNDGDAKPIVSEVGGVSDSAYRVFRSPAGHFEPSALVSLGLVEGRNLFVVGSDKDSERLYLFDLDDEGELTFKRYLHLKRPPSDTDRLKIEAIALANGGSANSQRSIFIAGRRIASDNKNEAGRRAGTETLVYRAFLPLLQPDEKTEPTLTLTPVPASETTCDAILVARKNPNALPCAIEGLAYLPGAPGRLVIGVRSVGEVGTDWQPLLGLVTLPVGIRGATPKVIHSADFPNSIGPSCKDKSAYGISDLSPFSSLVPSKSELLILASYEKSPTCERNTNRGKVDGKGKRDDKKLRQVDEVQGAVWRIPQSALDSSVNFSRWFEKAAPVVRLAHKPEGIAVLAQDTNTALIIFDDDASRKSVDRAPDTFPLRQSESVFTVLKLDPMSDD